jgi:hypothetical protein
MSILNEWTAIDTWIDICTSFIIPEGKNSCDAAWLHVQNICLPAGPVLAGVLEFRSGHICIQLRR